MTLVNLGCGHRHHPEWVNIDFRATSPTVMAHDLRRGIPLASSTVDVVYHSHVLEHFTKPEGHQFILECFRVLRSSGIIRVVVPDLERIAREYLRNLERCLAGEAGGEADYDWIMLELYDQVVRDISGGEMLKYLSAIDLPNEDYVFSRVGEEARAIRRSLQAGGDSRAKKERPGLRTRVLRSFANLPHNVRSAIRSVICYRPDHSERVQLDLGRFRKSGEIHQWMYDRYSLRRLLESTGFTDARVVTAVESSIPNWEQYELDAQGGIPHKPDSLYVEARKP